MSAGLFTIRNHSGFSIGFPNGWGVSVLFGHGTYSDHHDLRDWQAAKRAEVWSSELAEIAVHGPDGMITLPDGSEVEGYCDALRVAAVIGCIAAIEEGSTADQVRAWLAGCAR
jgi:hypothetical protein